jgi:uncharacterized heparinase superfamily protein
VTRIIVVCVRVFVSDASSCRVHDEIRPDRPGPPILAIVRAIRNAGSSDCRNPSLAMPADDWDRFGMLQMRKCTKCPKQGGSSPPGEVHARA